MIAVGWSGWVNCHRGTILTAMGFNPHRPQTRTAADYAMVAGAVLACVLLLAWAFLG